MINKLLANLPFNPSMLEDVSFYAKRLRRESFLRKIGLAFIILSLVVQIFAAAVPPEKSLAQSSNNDVVIGGVANIGRMNKVQNITQNLSSEQTPSAKARASDVIEYSLTTTNKNDDVIINYDIEDGVGDILDYAAIDQAFLSQHGGMLSTDKKTIVWANQTIPAKGELRKVFRVVMKNPLPTTNQPNKTAPDFDCKIENAYGSSTSIPVDCAVLKSIEQLPNTGPGTSVGIAFAITVVSTYFFARSHLLAKELMLVKKEYTSGGA